MIRTDSRKVKPGDTFVALKGIASDGDAYIPQAIANGAAKIVCSSGQYEAETINVPDTRKYLEEALVSEYGSEIAEMTIIGVTGTNGKTTTCYLISQALCSLGIKCAYIGTIGFYMGEKIRSLPNTSVDICSLYELLLEAREAGYMTVALEASSQGLALGRLNTISFDIGIFTNLTEDHLDYHKTMDNYAAAKRMMFEHIKPGGCALLNADDPAYCRFMLGENRNFTYGLESGDYTLKYGAPGPDRRRSFTLNMNARTVTGKTSLSGRHNMYNLLACCAALDKLGVSENDIASAAGKLCEPDGRFQTIVHEERLIIIDYAHTPDAMEKVFDAAAEMTPGDTYVVFGCTGDREREKRPEMTRIGLSRSKMAVLTDDDVHDEDEQQIFDDMLRGNKLTNYEICPDRRKAIERGLELTKAGDTLLILGKGHEDFIIKGKERIPHNDKKAVMEILCL